MSAVADRQSSADIVPGPLSSEQLLEMGRGAALLQDAELEARERPSIDERLESLRAARTKGRGKPGAIRRFAPASGGAFAVLAMAAAWMFWLRAPSSLDFVIGAERAPGEVGAWIAATPAGDTPVAFSDGSRLDLRADGRARVVETSEVGARVLLERGSVGVSVVHRDTTKWAVVSGPFEIRVIGTKFEASWSAADEALTVRLDEGEVAIAAPCLREPHKLVRGESVRLSCKDVVAAVKSPAGATQADPVDAAPRAAGSAETPPDPVPAAAAEPAATPAPASSAVAPSVGSSAKPAASGEAGAPPSAGVEAAPSWRELSKQGKPKDAFAAAEKEGLDGLLASAPSGELLELANLARLAGRGASARRAYLSVRDRFGGSDAAASAAFHLGRMSFDGSGAYAEAGRWFSTYLAERPGGAFAPEAMGRLMEAAEKSGDHTGARNLATRYLASYPNGAHAALAKSLLAP
jgi:transmembrane sensor